MINSLVKSCLMLKFRFKFDKCHHVLDSGINIKQVTIEKNTHNLKVNPNLDFLLLLIIKSRV